jgi:hypothetical protein
MALAWAVEPAASSVPLAHVVLPAPEVLPLVDLLSLPLELQAASARELAATRAAIEIRRVRPTTFTVLDWCAADRPRV